MPKGVPNLHCYKRRDLIQVNGLQTQGIVASQAKQKCAPRIEEKGKSTYIEKVPTSAPDWSTFMQIKDLYLHSLVDPSCTVLIDWNPVSCIVELL